LALVYGELSHTFGHLSSNMSAAVASLNEVQQQQQHLPQSDTTNESNNIGSGNPTNAEEDRKLPAVSGPYRDGLKTELANQQSNQQQLQTAENQGDQTNVATKMETDASIKNSGANVEGNFAAAKPAGMDDDRPRESSVLPPGLLQILLEVAQSGTSSTLQWNPTPQKPQSSATASATSDGATKKVSKKRSLAAFSNSVSAPVALRPGAAAASFLASSGASAGGNAPKQNPTGAAASPRKKNRNGLHNRSSSGHTRRPIHLIRTSGGGGNGTTTATATATTTLTTQSPILSAVSRFGPSTSGSEPEDTSHYDSEGTSTTSTSEFSYDQHHWQLRHRSQHLNLRTINTSALRTANTVRSEGDHASAVPRSLREAFKCAAALILHDWYERKGGYKLSPAEAKIHKGTAISSREIFRLRKQRLLQRLEGPESQLAERPPFTIQRVAEVLVAPDKYYTQTHKLFNCLEKLLLVSSSITAFGGSRGGVTSQSRREEQELAALADERDRIQSEFRQLRRRRSSLASDTGVMIDQSMGTGDGSQAFRQMHTAAKEDAAKIHEKMEGASIGNESNSEVAGVAGNPLDTQRQELEAAARASLRNKFDHVGIDPHHHHHGAVATANMKAINESRSMTKSPPPPSLTSAPNLSGGVLRSPHATHGEHPTSPVRTPSPVLFAEAAAATTSPKSPSQAPQPPLANPNVHLLQMHHAAAVAGVSPFDLMTLGSTGGPVTAAGSALLASTMSGLKEQDLESRSSASSDVDSESDDVSFDDSASDRSDGSDSGVAGPPAPAASSAAGGGPSNFSALAQAMALKRTSAAAANRNVKIPVNEAPQSVCAQSPGGAAPAAAAAATTDDPVPEDSDVSDSSLSDMAE